MSAIFPSMEWLIALKDKLNSDENYKKIASKWEGDIIFDISPTGALEEQLVFFIGLWHGECLGVEELESPDDKEAVFILEADYDNIVKVLKGQLDPMQAMLTRKLKIKGNLGVMMRNVPTVFQFVKCAQEITDEILGE